MWLKWAMGCECLVWSPWKTLTAPHSTTVLVNNTPGEYLQGVFLHYKSEDDNLKLMSHSR